MKRTKILSQLSRMLLSLAVTVSITTIPSYGPELFRLKREAILQFSTIILQLTTS